MKYRKLKGTTDHLRNLYGNALICYYVSAVAYYAEAPYVLLGNRGQAERIIMIYFAVSGVIWIIAAEFHNDVRKMRMKKIIKTKTLVSLRGH